MQNLLAELRYRTTTVIERLEWYGVRVGRGARALRHLGELERISAGDSSDASRTVRGVGQRLLAELDDLETILAALPLVPQGTDWQEKLQRIVDDEALPDDDQFAFVIASVFRQAGYAVAVAGQDVVLDTSLGPFRISARRLSVQQEAERVVRDARRQLEGTAGTGAIAVDVSVLVSPDSRNTEVLFFDADAYVAYHALTKTKQLAAAAGLRDDTTSVAGILGYAAMTDWGRVARRVSYVKRWAIVALVPADDPRHALLHELAQRLR